MLDYEMQIAVPRERDTEQSEECVQRDELPRFRAPRGTGCRQVVHRPGDPDQDQTGLRTLSRQAAAGTMMAGLLHEMASALMISSFSRMVLNDFMETTALPGEVAESICELDNSTDHVLALFEALRVFVRKEQGDYERCTVERLVSSVSLLCKAYLRKRIVLEIEPMPAATVLVSEALFLQVLVGLVKNAYEASPPEGRINLAAKIVDQSIQISVSDEGPGVAPGELPRLFEPLATSKSSSGGSGLGLAMARAIVSEFHGTISYANSSLGGAQFCISLPLALDDHPDLSRGATATCVT